MRERITGFCWVAVAGLLLAAPALAADPAIVGRWDITLGDGPTPSWIGVELKDGKLHGRFLDTAGGVHPIGEVKFADGKVEFTDKGSRTWTGDLEGDTIAGTRKEKNGKEIKWTAKRFVPKASLAGVWTIEGQKGATLRLRHDADPVRGFYSEGSGPRRLSNTKLEGYAFEFALGEKNCSATVKGDVMEGTLGDTKFIARRERANSIAPALGGGWDEPIELFNGKDLNGWKPLGSPANFKWKVEDGMMRCAGGSSNIVTERTFKDFKLHVEFKVPKGGNSGVYLRGRHEVQVADSHGRNPEPDSCGSMYSRIIAKETACTPAGEWQTFDITLVGHFVTVVHNGKTIIDNQEIEGITGGAIDSNESEPGPIYLQGDHSAVDYRKVTLAPATEPSARRGGRARSR